MTNIVETWRSVKGYESLYEISNLGNIKSVGRIIKKGTGVSKTIGQLMKPCARSENSPYMRVSLSVDGRVKTKNIHRMVAIAFIPNPENKKEVNHIDGDKHNNMVENLEWATSSENKKHAYRLGLQKIIKGEKINVSKLTNLDVAQIKKLLVLKINQYDIAKKFNISQSNVSLINSGKAWAHVSV